MDPDHLLNIFFKATPMLPKFELPFIVAIGFKLDIIMNVLLCPHCAFQIMMRECAVYCHN